MKTPTLVLSLLASITISAAGVLLAPSFATAAQPAPVTWLTLPQIHQKLEAAGYSNIEKIERERDSYEVRAMDRNGTRLKLHVDPHSGAVIESKQRRDERRARDKDKDCDRDCDCKHYGCNESPRQPATAPAAATR
jgi:hypothetical protein